MHLFIQRFMFPCFLATAFIACKPNKEEQIKKAREAFVNECNTAAKANPGAGNINFEPYCDCAWDKLMKDKKFEEMIVTGNDKSPEAMEYANKKIEDPEFQKDLEACKDQIKM
ncbi:MAG TPA: hypothetical protein VK177_08840 [Flavobacteriales bacterium]|nr:hypothetical protein [Flavobacteriales bacterium]